MTLIVYRAIFQESLPYEPKGQGRFALINHSRSAVHVYIYTYTWKDCAPTPTVDFIDQVHMIRFNNLTLCKMSSKVQTRAP